MESSKFINLLEDFAPIKTQENWDNSGWQIDLKHKAINKVLLAISVTPSIVKQAIEEECDLILSHHPIFFDPIKKVDDEMIVELVKNDIQVYSAHTNLDKAIGGVSDTLCLELGFCDFYNFNEFVKIVDLDEEKILDDLVKEVKESLDLAKIKVVNNNQKNYVKKIAISAGAGADFIEELKNKNIDLYITSDIKYHEAIKSEGMILFDIGHLESEQPILEVLKNLLEKENLTTIIAEETSIFKYI